MAQMITFVSNLHYHVSAGSENLSIKEAKLKCDIAFCRHLILIIPEVWASDIIWYVNYPKGMGLCKIQTKRSRVLDMYLRIRISATGRSLSTPLAEPPGVFPLKTVNMR